MKVKELRQKVADFGDKNRKHYEGFQPEKAAAEESATENSPNSKDSTNMMSLPVDELDNLAIETKPSTASTCPSSSYEDDLTTTAKVLLGPYLNKLAVNRSYSFDSSSPSNGSSDSTLPPPPQYSSSTELDHVMGKDHIGLLEKQAPKDLNSKRFSSGKEAPDDEETFYNHSPVGSMHNSTLLQRSLLTKSTLDTLCQAHRISEEQGIPHCTSSTAASVHSGGTSMAMSDDIDSTKSSGDSKGSDAASIVPGALSPKMMNLFLRSNEAIPEADSKTQTASEAPVVMVRRKMIRPEDLPFLKSEQAHVKEEAAPVVIARRKTITPDDLPFLKSSSVRTSDPLKASDEINPKPRNNTSVGHGIRKFGGRKSRIESRKEELNKKWAQSNSVTFVRKETWEFSQKTGGYKKKVYIEKEAY